MSHAVTLHRDIDELLGDADGRFFGSGYRRTHPALKSLVITHRADASSARASGSLGIAGTWSAKGGVVQLPHLGTTDVIVLGMRLAQALVASRYAPRAWSKATVSSLAIRAGSAPTEEGLGDFECAASLAPTSGGSALVAQIGSMGLRVELLHGPLPLGLAGIEAPDEAALVGPASARVYGTRWSERRVEVRDVVVDAERVRASAIVGLGGSPVPADGEGLCFVDQFVAALQLGQVLLYRLDSLDRASSDTLWMRSTRFTCTGAPPASPAPLSVQLEGSRLLSKDGGHWRCADVVGRFGGTELRCSVAHRIPSTSSTGRTEEGEAQHDQQP
ncbi:AvrD family protein [Sinomonas sp. ASV322]|uniref:AvrD family protein n=1 Tax=Sinomonas sp. ASV322 TaxID=3041920 RepID=UPI0027DBE7A8|nr:AvrD family protein [Sinomonas sp. ASV322]MDQ4504030.1 AvrD family protein [Sinomonas sp. ASV322]